MKIILAIFNKLTYNSRDVCGCSTLNEMLIKLASLMICSMNDHLTNTSSTPPSEVKKKSSTIYNTFNNFV